MPMPIALDAAALKNCGTGAGGFHTGNTCAPHGTGSHGGSARGGGGTAPASAPAPAPVDLAALEAKVAADAAADPAFLSRVQVEAGPPTTREEQTALRRAQAEGKVAIAITEVKDVRAADAGAVTNYYHGDDLRHAVAPMAQASSLLPASVAHDSGYLAHLGDRPYVAAFSDYGHTLDGTHVPVLREYSSRAAADKAIRRELTSSAKEDKRREGERKLVKDPAKADLVGSSLLGRQNKAATIVYRVLTPSSGAKSAPPAPAPSPPAYARGDRPAMPASSAPVVEHKCCGAPLLDAPEDQPGTVSAIVSVFNNVDAGNDRIRPGFFAKSIARKLPKGVWGHDWVTPVAKTLEARELHPGDPMLPPGLAELGGLYIKALFNLDTQRGREAYSDIKFGTIDEFSIGFRTVQSETDKKTGVRDLIEGDLLEWSPVLVGMNDRTRLLSVKAAPITKSVRHDPPAAGGSWSDYSREVATAVGEFAGRAERRVRNRLNQKAGRVLSQSNYDSIASVADAMESAATQLRDVLAAAEVRRNEPATAKSGTPPASGADSRDDAPSAIPVIPPVPADVPADPAPVPQAAGPDEADILAQYAHTQYALTMAAVGSLNIHA